MNLDLSVVVPVYNEQDNLQALYEEIVCALDPAGLSFEVLLVDDGSVDESFAIISELCHRDHRFRGIRFARNYGQTAAMAAGFANAKGQVVVPMDGDLQNDPSDIHRLLEKLGEGYDVVSGWRKDRKDTMITRKIPSMLANGLISRMTHVHLHDYGCTLKAYRRSVLEKVNLYGELHRFVPALAYQVGARVAEIPVNHRARRAGDSKYGIDRTLRVVLDLMTVKFLLKYATRPLQLFGKWAALTFLAGMGAGMLTLYMKLFEGLSMNRNPLLILTAFLMFASVQFVAVGLLGELVTRTYHEVQNKPIYSIRDRVNFDASSVDDTA